MSELLIKDFFKFYLKKIYVNRTKLLIHLLEHIDAIYSDYIITHTERMKNIKEINEIITMLNITYNMILNKICETSNNKINDNNDKIYINIQISKFINISNNIPDEKQFNTILTLINIDNKLKLLIDKYIFDNNFNNIDEKIKQIMCNNGTQKINDIVEMFIENKYNGNNEILNILNEQFIPISIKIKNIKDLVTQEQLNISVNLNENNNQINNINIYYDVILLNNSNSIKQYIIIFGYFKNDYLNINIKTSQICNTYIDNIIQQMRKLCDNKKNKISHIPKSFKDIYLKQITNGDILIFKQNNFINKLLKDWLIYQKYSINSNFKTLFSDFIKAEIKQKFNIIKCLLLGSQSAINNAGLLFSLTKENKNGLMQISDIIYKNLNIDSQLKLQKGNVTIQTEIDKINEIELEDIDLKKQLMINQNIPNKYKKMALEKIEEMKSGNSEYYKLLQFVKIIINYPWINMIKNENENDDIFSRYENNLPKWKEIMEKTLENLDKKVYGHKESKDTIIELLGKWFSNPNSLGKAIGLKGPPGVGKTLLAKCLGDALNIPFTQINLGGIDDGSILTGHSITYSGAVPGLIIKKMVEAGKPRCIMFFDELDKASNKHGKNEINDILIHVIDINSNAEFNDKFFQDIRFPINKVLFIFSFNDSDKIDRILLDRMEIIEVKAYTQKDKLLIAKKFLIQEVLNDINIKTHTIEIKDPEIAYIIDAFTYEAGVRDLKRKIEKIILKLNKDRIYKTDIFKNNNKNKNNKNKTHIIITKEIIDKYLNKPNIAIKKIHTTNEIGIVNGLYATTTGTGGIIPILIYKHHMGKNGKFMLKLTGKQGTVMKESVEFAFTIATNLIKTKYCDIFFKLYTSGLHIHTPDGATSKDGPSAGCAFTLAFISKILNKRIKNTVAMTGEIELNGNITAIGGLEYKLEGAKHAGVKLVFIPKENENDVINIKETNKTLFDDTFKYIIVDHIKEVVDMALIESDQEIFDKDITFDKMFNHHLYINEHINIQNI
jgi:endopeptidase La